MPILVNGKKLYVYNEDGELFIKDTDLTYGDFVELIYEQSNGFFNSVIKQVPYPAKKKKSKKNVNKQTT